MRESLEDNEPLHDAVLRGAKEEFGATGVVERYLGAKTDTITSPHEPDFEKLTLYYAVRLCELGERTGTDIETVSKLEWYTPTQLLEIFDQQCAHTKRPELDERVVIKRFIAAYDL